MKLNAPTVGRLVATVALCGATLGIVGCGGGGGADEGKALFESKCGTDCHDLATVTNAASNYNTEAEWAALVKTMQDQSTNISDDDAAAISAYLAANM